jgi:GH43 family beta-xylosidase
MKKLCLVLLSIFLYSCNDAAYEVLDEHNVKQLTTQDTLVSNAKVLVVLAGNSISDEYPNILVKPKTSGNGKYYLFDNDTKLENDSTLLHYYSAFIIDSEGEFRKNGLWVYTTFTTEGTFPFQSEVTSFSVDSVPKYWKGKLPVKEGIYFYRNNRLVQLSEEQSEAKFKEKKKDGFYFFPNSGRLFDRININELD